MARKVIIDCDPGIDDAVALCLALFDPRLEVLAVTATAGSVPAEQATSNVQAIVEQLDPPRLPRIGAASPNEFAPPINGPYIHGSDGLGNSGLAVSKLHHRHPSEKIICDELLGTPDEVTIIALGPLTNIMRAFHRDPEAARMVGRIIIAGGSLNAQGDATPAAELNMYYDARAARSVFRSMTTKTLVPLEVTRQVAWDLSFLEQMPDQFSRVGALLHQVVPFAFRAFHQALGKESIYLNGALALIAAFQEELFDFHEMAADVETSGELTTGVTVFDRRPNREWRPNMEVAKHVDASAAKDCIMRGLAQAASQC